MVTLFSITGISCTRINRSSKVEILAEFKGMAVFHMVHHDGQSRVCNVPEPMVIRDQAAFDSLLAMIPAHQMSARQPAPQSNDPLLNTKIDFSTQMLIAVFSHSGDDFIPISMSGLLPQMIHCMIRSADTSGNSRHVCKNNQLWQLLRSADSAF